MLMEIKEEVEENECASDGRCVVFPSGFFIFLAAISVASKKREKKKEILVFLVLLFLLMGPSCIVL
jgi:hypothetical protein